MNLLTIIPNFDQRSPNKVAVEIFIRLKNQFKSSEIIYLNKHVESELSDKVSVRKLKFADLKLTEDTLVHSHGFLPDLLNIILNKTKKRGEVTSITTVHSLIDIDLLESKGFIGKIVFHIWINILRKMDVVFVLNNYAKNYYQDKYDLNNTKVVYNGLNNIHLTANNTRLVELVRGLKKNYTVIGTVSVLRKMKGVQHLIGALTENDDYFLVVIGDGEYREQLESMAKSLCVANRVLFLGHINKPYDVINEIDIFAIMSEFEGFPLSLLEAIALEIPCICNDIEIFRELFDEKSVVFTDTSSYKTIIDNLEKVKANRKKLILNAYRKYSSSYTWEKITNNYLEGIRNR